jgi:aminopeptidase C
MSRRSSSCAVTPQLIAEFKQAYQSDPRFVITTNAVCHNAVTDVILKRQASILNKHQVFSHKMKYKEAKITDQKSTVREKHIFCSNETDIVRDSREDAGFLV